MLNLAHNEKYILKLNWDYHYLSITFAKFPNLTTYRVGETAEKQVLSCITDGDEKWYNQGRELTIAGRITYTFTLCPSSLPSRYIYLRQNGNNFKWWILKVIYCSTFCNNKRPNGPHVYLQRTMALTCSGIVFNCKKNEEYL